ncbi:helix-turn-helix domain-containing protein [Dokdonia sp. 4H-3-7-5]|uniref:helix-turn-helix domain-containing protein n=1 Tax=Dokdonia sp. (strain 4H-3-7-5) TaxID=983548 RepID=UPI00020A648E|nr:helix-turn-helix transcriptional regulator [Dokdonia sp. 4H-3-7-5]AEE19463.1 helix-turn-helix domain protein [Dokdonia sp. 4H-3-7-5]
MDNDTFLYEYLGGNIKNLRKSRKLSQEELASFISLSRSSVANIESGYHQPSIHVIYQIAVVLECKITELLPSIDSYKKSKVEIDEKFSEILDSLPNKMSKKNLTFLKSIITDDEE